jgi:hypothetical protein
MSSTYSVGQTVEVRHAGRWVSMTVVDVIKQSDLELFADGFGYVMEYGPDGYKNSTGLKSVRTIRPAASQS